MTTPPQTEPAKFGAPQALDAELARLAHSAGSLRLQLAEGLEHLAAASAQHELGFPTVDAYALERCERSSRWVQESRALAKRLRALPAIRAEVLEGRMTFSMAQVVAAAACADDEAEWLAVAHGRTVRAMRELMRGCFTENAAADGAVSGGEPHAAQVSAQSDEERVALTVTVEREDAWLFERARIVAKSAGATTLEDAWDALLAEGSTSLMASAGRGAGVPFDNEEEDEERRRQEQHAAQIRDAAEKRAEPRLGLTSPATPFASPSPTIVFDGDAESTDAELRRIAATLAERDLELGELAERFWRADGWRRLGYATAVQYCRERLGMSLSTVKAKRALARRARTLPALREAVEAGSLGYEASRLVAAVASRATAKAWIERAQTRTIRHLREEVDAARMLARLEIDPHRSPPTDAAIAEIAALEARVLAGQVLGRPEAQEENEDAPVTGQMSAGRAKGEVTLKFRVQAGTRRFYRWLERSFARFGPGQVSFVRYLCVIFLDAWRVPESREEYAGIYARDGHRCTNPVCRRRGVTPHHLLFRSAGGDDSDDNVTSLCWWCHLEGVHGGRLRVEPPASAMRWSIGRKAHTTIAGRHRTLHRHWH